MKKGITIISLVITIVIMLILAGVGISVSLSLIEQAKYTAFINEMKQVDEAVTLIIMEGQLNLKTTEEILADIGERISAEDLAKMSDGLKYEIMYAREGFPENKTPSPVHYNLNDFATEESINSILYISGGVTGKEQAYIYDEQSTSNYKIEPTIIWGVEMHGHEYGELLVAGTGLLEKTKEDNSVPTPKVSVKISDGATNKIKNIEVTATESREGIAEISLIIGEDVIKTVKYNGDTQVNTIFEVKQNRTYTIKVTGVSGTSTAKSVKISSLSETIIFTPVGNAKWVKSQDITITLASTVTEQINEIKYQWTQSSTEPALDTFTNTCAVGETITGEGMTGEWYLWAYYETEAGETEIIGSDVFRFDNQGPTVSLTSTPDSETGFTLTATASDALVEGTLKYEFYVNDELKHTVETKDETVKYPVENISMNTYNCYVKVTDSLGNSAEQTVVATTKIHTWEKWSANSTTKYTKTTVSSYNCTLLSYCYYFLANSATFNATNGKFKIGSNVRNDGVGTYWACNISGYIVSGCSSAGTWQSTVTYGDFSNGTAIDSWNRKIKFTKYSSSATTTYSKGTTKHNDVYSANSSDYPNGGYKGGYWYVYKGIM